MTSRQKFAVGFLAILALLTGLAYAWLVAYDLSQQAIREHEAFEWGRYFVTVGRGLLANWHSAFLATLVVTTFLYDQMTQAAEAAGRAEARRLHCQRKHDDDKPGPGPTPGG